MRTCAVRRRPRVAEADEQRALEPAAVLVAAFEVDVRRPREVGPNGSTASWLEPESNQTSRMFVSRSNAVPPHAGQARPVGHELLDRAARTRRRRRTRRTPSPRARRSPAVSMASPQLAQSSAGIGTPQARWREMHQSGRFATMLKMRSRPHGGIHSTSLIDRVRAPPRAASAARAVRRRRPARRPSAMNHCDVARKMTGLWHRQQCGYVCWYGS